MLIQVMNGGFKSSYSLRRVHGSSSWGRGRTVVGEQGEARRWQVADYAVLSSPVLDTRCPDTCISSLVKRAAHKTLEICALGHR